MLSSYSVVTPIGAISSGPSLNLDFTTGILDSRIAFSRADATPIATYVNSSGIITVVASNNAPRFGYNPSTLEPLGLLIEETRTNTQTKSGIMSDAGYTGGTGSIKTSTNNSDPFGGSNAALVTANGLDAAHSFSPATISPNVSSGVPNALSCFVKAGTTDLVQLTHQGTAYNTTTVYVNFWLIGAGVVGTIGAGVTSAAIEAFPDGWYRVSFVATPTSTAAAGAKIFFISSLTSVRAEVFVSASTLYTTGYQTEVISTNSPFALSYIPTDASAVTRAADIATMTGSNFSSWYNQAAGTFVAKATAPKVNQLAALFTASSGSNNNRVEVFKTDSAHANQGKRWGYLFNNATVIGQSSTDVAVKTCTVALAAQGNDFAFYSDGNQLATGSSLTMPTPTIFDIGANQGAVPFNGHIASIRYYQIRLANSVLQDITSLNSFLDNQPTIAANSFIDGPTPSLVADHYFTNEIARVVYQTNATSMSVTANTNYFSALAAYGSLGIDVDGAYHSTIQASADGAWTGSVTLPGGSKTVEISAGHRSATLGAWVVSVTGNAPLVPVSVPLRSERFILFGDSIAGGGHANPFHQYAWSMQLRRYAAALGAPMSVESMALSGIRWSDVIPNAGAVTSFANSIIARNPTIIWFACGVNDYASPVWTSAAGTAKVADLVDALHVGLPSAHIYLQTPIVKNTGEGANGLGETLPTWRSAIAAVASGRAWVTAVDGVAIMTGADLDVDGLHPNNTGQTKIYIAAKTALGI